MRPDKQPHRRVVVLNNYPLDRVWREVRLGETPDHHLFGLNYFNERGYEPIVVPVPSDGRWVRWQRRATTVRWPIEWGNLQQQRDARQHLRAGDLIYAPCGTQTHWLQYRRALGLLASPIVCLVHHPFPSGRLDLIRAPWRWLFATGADRLPSLSRGVAEALRRAGAPACRTGALRWGPQASYYQPQTTPGAGVVAAGRTGRDFMTLARAARQVDTAVTIIGLENQLRDEVFRDHSTLRVIAAPNDPPQPGRRVGWMKYPALLEHLARARAIAIPLFRQDHLCGATSLMDALGLGKPVIMTRNPQIDLDIEALGIGRWVEPGDVEGWIRAIEWFERHPDAAVAMGARARQLVDAGLDSRSFAHQIMDLFDQVLSEARA